MLIQAMIEKTDVMKRQRDIYSSNMNLIDSILSKGKEVVRNRAKRSLG